MELRMDKDDVIYINDPANSDLLVIFPTIDRRWQVESRRFGYLKRFNSQLKACVYCRELINQS